MRNARFSEPSPKPDYPEQGKQLWQWFQKASKTRRYDQGLPQKLTPMEWQSWAQVTGQMIREEEFSVLLDMDDAYINALRAELKAQWDRNKPKPKGKR